MVYNYPSNRQNDQNFDLRNACKKRKAHILTPGDNCKLAAPPHPLSPKPKKMSFFVSTFLHKMPTKKLIFLLLETTSILPPRLPPTVSRRQNMSFFYFASIPKYDKNAPKYKQKYILKLNRSIDIKIKNMQK